MVCIRVCAKLASNNHRFDWSTMRTSGRRTGGACGSSSDSEATFSAINAVRAALRRAGSLAALTFQTLFLRLHRLWSDEARRPVALSYSSAGSGG